jgi:hypothetical protein
VSNTVEMVHLESTCRDDCSFSLSSDTELPIVSADSPMKVPDATSVMLPNFRISSAIVHGAKDSELSMNVPSEVVLVIQKDFVWTSVLATIHSGPHPNGILTISGHGRVTSLKQDGREVLPSKAEEFLTADPAHFGLYGGLLVLIVFGWGLLFKRTMDLIAKAIIPE